MSEEEIARKYDALAERYSSQQYADPEAVASRQVDLVRSWGTPVVPGASVLEIACADGFVTAELVRAGFRVTGIDLSSRMIEVARARLEHAGLEAELYAADISRFEPNEKYDVVLAFVRPFFVYVSEPETVLRRLAAWTRAKILVDVNPRMTRLDKALDLVRRAGFDHVTWQPFFVPQRVRVGRAGLKFLRGMEHVPLVRDLILRRKFFIVIKGEKA